MKNKIFLISLISLTVTSGCNAQTAGAPKPNVQQTANEIRIEATRKNSDPAGHALPLLASWNTGQFGFASPTLPPGFDPAYQIELVEKGHHVLPSFSFPGIPKDAASGKAAVEKMGSTGSLMEEHSNAVDT